MLIALKTGWVWFGRPLFGLVSGTHMLEEDAELWVGVWIDGGLENRQENVLQHFAKVGDKVPASEDVTKIDRGLKKVILICPLSVFLKFYEWTHMQYICSIYYVVFEQNKLIYIVWELTRYGALESSIWGLVRRLCAWQTSQTACSTRQGCSHR